MTASPLWKIFCDGETPDPDMPGEWRPCVAWAAQEATAPDARRYAKGGGWVRRFLPAYTRWVDLCPVCQKFQRFGGDKLDSEAVPSTRRP